MFSIEDIKKKYMDFLRLEPSDFESHAEEGEEHQLVESEDEGKMQEEISGREEEVNKEELIDELKKLDIENQEETAYIDINYWKTSVDYNVDELLAEINQTK